jgi:hypothetical protein
MTSSDQFAESLVYMSRQSRSSEKASWSKPDPADLVWQLQLRAEIISPCWALSKASYYWKQAVNHSKGKPGLAVMISV